MRISQLLGTVLGLTLGVLPAMAQQAQVGKAPEVSAWPAILVATALSAVIIIGSFKGSKRGHQD